MLDRRISTARATPIATAAALSDDDVPGWIPHGFAGAGLTYIAAQYEKAPGYSNPAAAGYAAANSLTRRRLDAVLREAETMARIGLQLLGERSGREDAATAAAARFLGKSLSASLRRFEDLLSPNRL